MTSYEASLISTFDSPQGRMGKVSARGAVVTVSLQLVPDARPGDILVCDAGVAISCLSSYTGPEESHNVPGNSR